MHTVQSELVNRTEPFFMVRFGFDLLNGSVRFSNSGIDLSGSVLDL